jgi:hypothetical protein
MRRTQNACASSRIDVTEDGPGAVLPGLAGTSIYLTASSAREFWMLQPQIPPGGLQQQLDDLHRRIVPTPQLVTSRSTSWTAKGLSRLSLNSTV